MGNIIKIYRRLRNVYVKERLLLILLTVQNTVLSLIVLIYANGIISNGKINGVLNYSQVRLFYSIAIFLVFVLVIIYSPMFLSNTLNNLYKNNVIEHFLSVKIKMNEIVFAVYFRGLVLLLILLISSFPIICISFYFGGFGIENIIRLFILLISVSILVSAVCILISSKIMDSNVSIILSYIVVAIMIFFHLFYLNRFINSISILLIYVIISLLISLILLTISSKNNIYFA